MKILPLALTPRRILLIGAGKAAAQKARAVLQSDCVLDVLAREIRDPFFDALDVQRAEFSLAWLEAAQQGEGYDIIIDATGDAALSRRLWKNRRRLRFWLNAVDLPECCDFYFTAQARDHDLCVSVSTGGASPGYARDMRDLLAACLPRREPAFYDELRRRRDPSARPDARGKTGKVFLIGCGPGNRENLTLGALQTLKFLDVALIDALVGEEIVELLPAACLKIDVSKQKGHHHYAQEEINAMMRRHAREGLRVGRLKGGDPAVFGCFFEEAAFLAAHGIEQEWVSGVSAAFAGCLAGGIAPTRRGVSSGALIVSAHLRETRFNDEWIVRLKDFPYTVIVLMAWSFAARIVESARANGVSLSLPAVFVSRVGHPDETAVFGTLADLENMAARCRKPAILVIGEAVAKARIFAPRQ